MKMTYESAKAALKAHEELVELRHKDNERYAKLMGYSKLRATLYATVRETKDKIHDYSWVQELKRAVGE